MAELPADEHEALRAKALEELRAQASQDAPGSTIAHQGPVGRVEPESLEASRVESPQRQSVEIGDRVPADRAGLDEIPW